MSKVHWTTLFLGVALGANLVLGAWVIENHFSPRTVMGQTVDTVGRFTAATGRLQGKGEADGLYIIDHEQMKLLVYFDNGRRLELLHVRDMSGEMGIKFYGEQEPEGGFIEKEVRKRKKKN